LVYTKPIVCNEAGFLPEAKLEDGTSIICSLVMRSVKFTALNGNIDTDNFIQWVKVAQDIHMQSYLGTKVILRK